MNVDTAALRSPPHHAFTSRSRSPLRRAAWFVERNHRALAAVVVLVAGINLFYGLARTKIPVFDEAYYGVMAAEMCDRHDWIRSTFLGETDFWNLKPPLGYWLIAACYKLVGFNRLALRLPSAISAFTTILVWMAILRRRHGWPVAILAGGLLTVAFPFVMQHTGRTGEVDAQLALVLTLALSLWPTAEGRPGRLYAIAALLSVGFLLKSFAIAPAIMIMVVDAAVSGSWRTHRLRHVVGAALVFTALPALWAVARYRCDGTVFLARMFHEDLFLRYTSDIDASACGYLDYCSSLFQRWHPGGVLILLALGAWIVDRARRTGRAAMTVDPSIRFLALWLGIPVVLYSLSGTQHKHYINPVYPAFVALAALSFRSLVRRVQRPALAFAIILLTAVGATLDEANILGVLHDDLGPHPQDFLAGTVARAIHAGDVVVGVRPWTGVEAFILEVEDRAKLRMVEPDQLADIDDGALALVDAAVDVPASASLVARSAEYALYRLRRQPTIADSPVAGAMHAATASSRAFKATDPFP